MAKKSTSPKPRQRQRRKEARPGEIVAAAIEEFAARGFAAAKLEAVARRAGVAKGTVFVYFPTKKDLFRAVAQSVIGSHLGQVQEVTGSLDHPLRDLIPALLTQAANLGASRISGVIRLLIVEARAFPDLTQVWYDEVVSKALSLLTRAIEGAQARREIREGDARLYAFSIIGPIMAGVVFRHVFGATDGAQPPDLHKLAAQHANLILDGLMTVNGSRSATVKQVRRHARQI